MIRKILRKCGQCHFRLTKTSFIFVSTRVKQHFLHPYDLEQRFMKLRNTPEATRELNQLMDNFVDVQNFEKALEVWNIIQKPSSVSCGILLKALLRMGRTDKAEEALQEMMKNNLHPTPQGFGCLIHEYLRNNNISKALSTLRLMLAANVKPTVETCLQILRFGAQELSDREFDWLLSIELMDKIPRDVVVSTAIIGRLVKMGRVEKAYSEFKKLPERNIKPNIVTMNTMLTAFTSTKQNDKVQEILDAIKKNNLSMDKVSYRILINACLQEGDHEKAWNWFIQCLNSLEPVDDVKHVLKGVFSIGFSDFARKMFDEILRRNKDTPIIYHIMIVGYVTQGNYSEALKLFEQARNAKNKPLFITYVHLFSSFVNNNLLDLATNMLSISKADGIIIPKVELGLLIQALCRERKPESAEQLIETLQSEYNMTLSVNSFNPIINEYVEKEDFDKVNDILRIMEENNIESDCVTFTIIIKGLCRKGDIKSALDMFSELKLSNVKPDVIIYNTLIGALIRHKMYQKANQLLQEMDELKIFGNSVTAQYKRQLKSIQNNSLSKRNHNPQQELFAD